MRKIFFFEEHSPLLIGLILPACGLDEYTGESLGDRNEANEASAPSGFFDRFIRVWSKISASTPRIEHNAPNHSTLLCFSRLGDSFCRQRVVHQQVSNPRLPKYGIKIMKYIYLSFLSFIFQFKNVKYR